MIQPNRYHLWAALECHAFSKAEAVLKFSAEEDGMWVQWQDYARLKADFYQASDERADYAKDVSKLQAEVERLRKAGEWQPIETAPKDGTVIWATNSTWKRPDYVKWGRIDHIDEWAWVHTHNRHNRTPEPVTHWMPIPKPPQEGKQP